MTSPLINKLAERGYWRVEIRPLGYLAKRVEALSDLRRFIEKAHVQLRGWDFPHIDNRWGAPESQTSLSQEVDWSVHVELWQAHLSGLFIYRGGVWTDWLDQAHFAKPASDWEPKRQMGIVNALWSLTEFFEFAARYSQTAAGDEAMRVDVAFIGLRGRVLNGDHDRRVWLDHYGPAKADTFEFSRELSRTTLIVASQDLAREAAKELYGLFGYEPHAGILEELQQELLQARHGR